MFWDSSAVVPLLLAEARSAELVSMLADDTTPIIWWSTPVECQAACYRRRRDAAIASPIVREALKRLEGFCEDATQVSASDTVRRRALRLLATHPLRTGDALQLAAALVWCEENSAAEKFVCLDQRLRAAATAEGFDVRPLEND